MDTCRMFCAGFGGQGVMVMGQLFAYAGMFEERNVTWCPSYGPEMRGGTANCSVVVSNDEIAAPVISSNADVVVVMNNPSLEKFEKTVRPGGNLFINSSIVDIKPTRKDINIYYVPIIELAKEMGVPKLANIIMVGAIMGKIDVVKFSSMEEAVKQFFGSKKSEMVEINKKALRVGAQSI